MLTEILAQYLKLFPNEKSDLSRLLGQIKNDETLSDRRNFNGHITGSGIVLSPDKTQILFIYHRFFQLWQQPGGHWEGREEPNPFLAARREIVEETGITITSHLAIDQNNPLVPLDIDTHAVPARPEKDEPAHWHHDFRFVFISATTELHAQLQEVSEARWFPLSAPETKRVARPLTKLSLLLAAHE